MKGAVGLAQKYLLYAEDLDRKGFHDEATSISIDIARFLDETDRQLTNGKRFAIRGRSSWEDYLQTITTGAGSGAAAGAAMGGVSGLIGGPAAPATIPAGMLAGAGTGALWGAAGGLLEKAGSDTLYNLSGNISKAKALSKDFGYYANQLTQLYPQAKNQIMEVVKILQDEVNQVYETKRAEIAKQYGLDPNVGFWQSLKNPGNWGKMIGSKFRTYRSSKEEGMKRVAQETGNPNSSSGVSDDVLRDLYHRFVKPKPAAIAPEAAVPKALAAGGLAGGAAMGAAALGGGMAGYLGTDYLYGKTEDLIRGREGKERYILSEMSQIMSEIGRLLNNPNAASFMTYLQNVLTQSRMQNVQPPGEG